MINAWLRHLSTNPTTGPKGSGRNLQAGRILQRQGSLGASECLSPARVGYAWKTYPGSVQRAEKNVNRNKDIGSCVTLALRSGGEAAYCVTHFVTQWRSEGRVKAGAEQKVVWNGWGNNSATRSTSGSDRMPREFTRRASKLGLTRVSATYLYFRVFWGSVTSVMGGGGKRGGVCDAPSPSGEGGATVGGCPKDSTWRTGANRHTRTANGRSESPITIHIHRKFFGFCIYSTSSALLIRCSLEEKERDLRNACLRKIGYYIFLHSSSASRIADLRLTCELVTFVLIHAQIRRFSTALFDE